MRQFITFLFLTLAFTVFAAKSTEAQQQSKAEQEVRKLEREWLDAYEKFDVEAMNRIVSDDFNITFTDGSMQTKAEIIEGLKKPRDPNRPANKFRTVDVQARVYGDTVILIGTVITEWQRGDRTLRSMDRYTDTYIKRQGRWQVVASHLSNIPPPK